MNYIILFLGGFGLAMLIISGVLLIVRPGESDLPKKGKDD